MSGGRSRTKRNTAAVSIDSRVGSVHLRTPLRKLGLTTRLVKLDSADVSFLGTSGPVGIELKRVEDLAKSITSGRLTGKGQRPGQVQRMVKAYSVNYLIMEGLYRPGKDQMVETFDWKTKSWRPTRNRLTYTQLHGAVTSIEEEAAFRLRRSMSDWETAVIIANLYKWHQKVHHSTLRGYNHARDGASVMEETTQVELVAQTLPGIDWVIAHRVAAAIDTVDDLVSSAILGGLEEIRGIGKVKSREIARSLITRYVR